MNAYSELLRYIKKLSEEDSYITTVLARVTDDFDWEKANIFPIMNMSVLTGVITSTSTVMFNVELTCVDKRIINKDDVNDKFWSNDNEVDNHNSTLNSLTTLWVKMNRDFARNNITASNRPDINQIEFNGMNLADGWTLSFSVEMPIEEVDLCNTSC